MSKKVSNKTLIKYEGISKSFRTESITKYTLTFGITRWEATQRVMAAKLTRLTHKIAIQLPLVAESCTISSSRSRRPVRKLLDTPSYNSYIMQRDSVFHRSWWNWIWALCIVGFVLDRYRSISSFCVKFYTNPFIGFGDETCGRTAGQSWSPSNAFLS
jgi:hypothetical protein